jgi:hypothetical protein
MAEDLKKEQANQQQPYNRNNTINSGSSSGTTATGSQEITYAHNDHRFIHAEHGVLIDQQSPQNVAEEEEYEAHHDLWWTRTRHILKDPFAEFMGTFIMIVFGDGSVAQVLLSTNPNLPKGDQGKGDYQSISWGWGIGGKDPFKANICLCFCDVCLQLTLENSHVWCLCCRYCRWTSQSRYHFRQLPLSKISLVEVPCICCCTDAGLFLWCRCHFWELQVCYSSI